jgi:head-tail adaptor
MARDPLVIDPGTLRHSIAIQSESTTPDAAGQPISTWTTVRTCMADIDVQKSSLIYETSTFISKVVHRITFRWTPVVIQPNMRIIYVDAATAVTHTYNIESLLNVKNRNRVLIALCYELNASE